MSFAKAHDLLRLARKAAACRTGLSLDEIASQFGVSHRTAQRMTDALEDAFDGVVVEDGADRRRRWRIEDRLLERLNPRQEPAIEALEIAVRAAREQGRLRHSQALSDLRDGLLAHLPRREALRSEADAEAVLSAMGNVTRPGPRENVDPDLLDAVIEALRGPFRMRIQYKNAESESRVIEPHGFLLGHRCYVVARQLGRGDALLNFRLDRLLSAECLDESFALTPGFTIQGYAARAFGVFQDDAQYGEVIWRFRPEAAARAAEFAFHPTQTSEHQEDGSLIVKFHASGWLEMVWHLYQWGDKVEVLAPKELAALVRGHQRSDFDALP